LICGWPPYIASVPKAYPAMNWSGSVFYLLDSYESVLETLHNSEIDAYATRTRNERLPLTLMPEIVSTHTTYEPAIGALIFNWVNENLPVFREQRVRQALARGLDRTSLVERHMLNTAVRADSPFLPLSWAYDYDGFDIAWPNYDQAAARDLLASARLHFPEGVESPESGALFSFTILTLDDPALANMAQEIAAQWSQLNLDVAVESVSSELYYARLESAQFDVALVEFSKEGSADPDVYDFWHEGQYPDGQNYGGVNDRAISEALERARRDVNGTNRSIYYNQFQREFIERAIAIPLYYPLFTYAVSPKVSGVQLGFIGSPPDRFLTLRNWRIGE